MKTINNMIKHLTLILAAVATLSTAATLKAAEPASSPNYELAERFSPNKMRRVHHGTRIVINSGTHGRA